MTSLLNVDRIIDLATDPTTACVDGPPITAAEAAEFRRRLNGANQTRERRRLEAAEEVRCAVLELHDLADITEPLQQTALGIIRDLFVDVCPGRAHDEDDVIQIASELLAMAADFIHFDDFTEA